MPLSRTSICVATLQLQWQSDIAASQLVLQPSDEKAQRSLDSSALTDKQAGVVPGTGRSQCPDEPPVCVQLSDTILKVDCVIMPVHLGNHWTCAVIDLAAKELVYHDSMGVGPTFTHGNNT